MLGFVVEKTNLLRFVSCSSYHNTYYPVVLYTVIETAEVVAHLFRGNEYNILKSHMYY